MKRALFLFGALAVLSTYGHASRRMHVADIYAVFDGCDDLAFRRMAKRISSGMDNELPRRFRSEIGPVPGNHRILGHCWTFGDAIPRRVLDAIETRHPGRKVDFIALWQTFANEVVDEVSQVTGLTRKQSVALAALIHDVHLLGDRTPDNTLVDNVLTTDEIRRNIVKSAGTIWGRSSEVTRHLKDAGKIAYANGRDEFARAENLLSMMKSAGLGIALTSIMSVSQFDSKRGVMVNYSRLRAKALGQDIVRELIGSVKRLRVSRRTLSTPECSNQFACCKAVVGRNVRNFVRRYLAEESANALPLFVFLTGQSHGLYRNTEGRISFCV